MVARRLNKICQLRGTFQEQQFSKSLILDVAEHTALACLHQQTCMPVAETLDHKRIVLLLLHRYAHHRSAQFQIAFAATACSRQNMSGWRCCICFMKLSASSFEGNSIVLYTCPARNCSHCQNVFPMSSVHPSNRVRPGPGLRT